MSLLLPANRDRHRRIRAAHHRMRALLPAGGARPRPRPASRSPQLPPRRPPPPSSSSHSPRPRRGPAHLRRPAQARTSRATTWTTQRWKANAADLARFDSLPAPGRPRPTPRRCRARIASPSTSTRTTAWNIKMILDAYPVHTPVDVPGYFDKIKHRVAGEDLTVSEARVRPADRGLQGHARALRGRLLGPRLPPAARPAPGPARRSTPTSRRPRRASSPTRATSRWTTRRRRSRSPRSSSGTARSSPRTRSARPRSPSCSCCPT